MLPVLPITDFVPHGDIRWDKRIRYVLCGPLSFILLTVGISPLLDVALAFKGNFDFLQSSLNVT